LPSEPLVAGEPVISAVAPLEGGANVTCAPGAGLPYWSVTSATSGANDAPTVTVCGEPDETATFFATSARFVSANVVVSAPDFAVTS
jgi:hypothetical protein